MVLSPMVNIHNNRNSQWELVAIYNAERHGLSFEFHPNTVENPSFIQFVRLDARLQRLQSEWAGYHDSEIRKR
jgi:hypothetical protein